MKPKMSEKKKEDNPILKRLQNSIMARIISGVIVMILALVLIFSLTIAWQTNVIQTGGLQFTSEKWDFDGTVEISSAGIDIAPGESGVIDMVLTNNSNLLTSVSVSTSKAEMDDVMQNRLYFYVDTTGERNNEITERIWLNSMSSYTYTMLPHSELILNETEKEAPLIKWTWVYDVLGYYVLGTINGSTTEINEYLRPIEYDYDISLTTFDSTGNLLTTDGTTTAVEFLSQLSQSDGYANSIDASVVATKGYYPVSVNSEGYGVWAYLCTYDEINNNINIDTQLGTDEMSVYNLNASIIITGQNSKVDTVSVSSEDELISIIESSDMAYIKLDSDVELTKLLYITDGETVWIDLNGYSISSADKWKNIIEAGPGAELYIQNGSIVGAGEDSTTANTAAIVSNGANVTLENVTVTNVVEGLFIRDNLNDTGADSNISLINCTISCVEDGLLIYGNEEKSAGTTKIYISGCTIEGKTYTGLIFNGTNWGTDVVIEDTKITGLYAGIYFPQANSSLSLYNSEVTAGTGVVIKGGTVNIVDTDVTSTGEYVEPEALNSGWTTTGDAIYVETNYGVDIQVNISGDSNISSTYEGTLAVREYPEVDYADVSITGGTFTSDVSYFIAEGYMQTESTQNDITVYIVSESETE